MTDLLALDWDQARVFLAVARTGQLASAARRLELDVSTVSRRLDRMEAELGARLFDRGREGTTPTAVAESMIPAAEAMERAVGDLLGAFARLETAPEGVVRLTAPPGVADAFIAPILARFAERYPLVRVELDASIAYADLTRREADLAVRVARPTTGDLVATKLLGTRTLALTSPERARALGRLERLEDARWIGYGEALAHLPVSRWLSSRGVKLQLATSHFASQLRAAEAGLGVVLAPEPYRYVYRLAPIEPARRLKAAWAELPVDELWLVGHRSLREVPRVAALWETLVEELSERGLAALAAGRARGARRGSGTSGASAAPRAPRRA